MNLTTNKRLILQEKIKIFIKKFHMYLNNELFLYLYKNSRAELKKTSNLKTMLIDGSKINLEYKKFEILDKRKE
jgi:hypothetical protein